MTLSATQHLLKVTHLRKEFAGSKPFVAVDSISFELNEGEILGFLGPNGAGKTTTIQMLLGTLLPTSGSIHYFGKDFFTHRSEILKHVALASTYLKLPGTSTVYENLDVFGRLYGIDREKREQNIKNNLMLFDMWKFKDRKVHSLSAGQMTRVMLAKAFISEPKIVLLDEPTASLDPDIAAEVRSFVLQQQAKHKTAMIFTSHNMAEVEEVCDRVLVLKQGTIIANHTPEALAASVSRTHVRLMGVQPETFNKLAEEKGYVFSVEGHQLSIEIDEKDIASLFAALAQASLTYTQVSIDKPTLEDYFLQIAKT